MPNKIQIKRSTSTAAVSGLSNGELAFTQASNTLWIGLPDGSGVAAIGSVRYPGVLTANASLVANNTGYLDVIKTANLYIGATTVNTINAIANSTVLGAAGNNELTTTWAIKTYVDARAAQAGAGSVTNVDSGNGLTGGPINTTGTLSVRANNGITANATGVWAAGANGISVTSAGINVLAGNTQLVSNTTGVWITQGNIDHNSLSNYDANRHIDHTAVSISTGNGLTGGGTIAATRTLSVVANNGITVTADGVFADGANGISVTSAGINVLAGNSQLISNTTGLWANQGAFAHNSLGGYVADEHIAHSGVTLTAGNGLTGGGTIAASRSFAVVAGNTQLVSNSTGVWITQSNIDHNSLANYTADQHVAHSGVTLTAGNGLFGGGTIAASRSFAVVANSAGGLVSNSAGVWAIGANGISVTSAGINVLAGNSQLISNTTGVWANQQAFAHNSLGGYVADEHVAHSSITLTAGAGLSGGGTIAANRTFDIGAGVGILVNTDDVAVKANNGISATVNGVFVTGANGITVTTAGVNVLAGTGVVSNTTGVHIGQPVGTTDNVTFANVVTTNMTVSGTLNVTGTTTTISSSTLAIRDNMVVVADNQATTTTFTDAIDTGWYVPTGNTLNTFYSGIARIAASSSNTNPYFKLFATGTVPGTTTIATSANTGTLQAFLAPYGVGGAFIANNTAMALTANSTVSLAMAANTLSLTTALPVTSGGIGHLTVTSGDLLVGNNSNILTKLAAGSDGHVLQMSGTSVVWAVLDGGTF